MKRLAILILAAVLVAVGGAATRSPGGAGGDGGGERGRIVRVVDGDTLKVRVGARSETVRLIGIDTPESVRPGAPVECAAKAASRALRRRALAAGGRGRRVRLVPDSTQDRRDRYDRLLAYVELADGTDLGRAQVRHGWADVYVYAGRAFERAGTYRAASRRAEDERAGVHRRCGGDFHRPQ